MGQNLSPEEARNLRRLGQWKALGLGLLASSLAMACSFGEIDSSNGGFDNGDDNLDQPGVVDDDGSNGGGSPSAPSDDADPNSGGGSVQTPGSLPAGMGGGPLSPLDEQMLGMLERNCASCHGAAGIGGINYITNLEQLVANGKITMGDGENSELYVAIVQQRMPPPSVLDQRPSKADIELLKTWIDGMAELETCSNDGEFVSFDTMYRSMSQDIVRQDADDRQFIRYLGVVNAFNAGACGAALEREQYALLKTINSLSTESRIRQPQPIDARGLIYRIDIRDYGWDRELTVQPGDTKIIGGQIVNEDPSPPITFRDGWEAIVNFSQPYAQEFIGDDADQLKVQTGTNIPYLQVDAFIASSTRQNLYYELIAAPPTLVELFDQLGVDQDDQFDRGILARAGFSTSGVSKQERVVLRFELNQPGGTLWTSFDYADNGLQNASIYADPLGADVEAAGGEMIYNLPNGMMAFYVAANDGVGNRLTEAPTDVVVDPTQVKENGAVTNGVSCNGCHQRGMIQFTDTVREYALANPLIYNQQDYEDILTLYRPMDEWNELIQADNDYFQRALAASGVPVNLRDPVTHLYLEFDAGQVRLERAAGDLGFPPAQLQRELSRLPPQLRNIERQGGIDRELFDTVYLEALCILQVSSENRPLNCP